MSATRRHVLEAQFQKLLCFAAKQLQKELDCMREALTTRAKALRLDKVKGRELACPLTVAVNQGRLHVCQRMLQEFTARMKTWYINEYGDDE